MQVHDELVFEVAEGDTGALMEALQRLMGEAVELSVPLKVQAAAGLNWDEAH
jgi:DNA polymerase I